MKEEKYAIRFGLGAIKAVGFVSMEKAVAKRKEVGNFENIFDFAKKMDAKSVNKKTVEALAKAGAFDRIAKNRRQIFESFDVLSAYAQQQENEASSTQMNFFGELISEEKSKPELRKIEDWTKAERLQREFEAFGFFLNEHPLDDYVIELRKRGVVFCDKVEKDELEDGDIIKMAGIIATSKHRSGPKGRFAYLTISDPFGIFEAMVFDEALITNARDILADGSSIMIECLIRKDEGGVRILVRDVKRSQDFIKNVAPKDEPFEDIKKQSKRRFNSGERYGGSDTKSSDFGKFGKKEGSFGGGFKKPEGQNSQELYKKKLDDLGVKKIYDRVEIFIDDREVIFTLKAFLAARIAPDSFAKYSKVVLVVAVDGKDFKIELNDKYLLDDGDVARLKANDKVREVKSL